MKKIQIYLLLTSLLVSVSFYAQRAKGSNVNYEYYRLPVDLINSTDVPTIPEQFRYVIVNGAMHFAYLFRGEGQEAAIVQQRFEQEIKQMRSLYINRYDYVRSTVLTNTLATNTRVTTL